MHPSLRDLFNVIRSLVHTLFPLTTVRIELESSDAREWTARVFANQRLIREVRTRNAHVALSAIHLAVRNLQRARSWWMERRPVVTPPKAV